MRSVTFLFPDGDTVSGRYGRMAGRQGAWDAWGNALALPAGTRIAPFEAEQFMIVDYETALDIEGVVELSRAVPAHAAYLPETR